MIEGLKEGDVLHICVDGPSKEIQVRGKLIQKDNEKIRMKVISPPYLSVLTISQVDMFGDSLSAFEGYTWKRLGGVVELSVIKYSQPDSQFAKVADGGVK